MKQLAVILVVICCVWNVRAQESLTLDAYRQRVLVYSREVQMAGQTLAAAVAAAREARTAYFPTLAGSASYNYNFNPQTLQLGQYDITMQKQNWQAGGELSQSIYSGGKISGIYRSLEIEEQIASLNRALATDDASYAAEVAYWNAAASTANLEIAREYLGIVDTLRGLIAVRFADGYVGKPDLLKIETNYREAQYRLSQAEQLYVNDRIALMVTMGAPADSTVVLAQTIDSAAPAAAASTLDDALARRPEYRIGESQLALQEKQWTVERSDYLPKISIGGTVYYGTPPLNATGDFMLQPAVYARLSIPLFQWNKRKHTRDRSKAEIMSRELALSLTEDNIRQELAVSRNDMERSRQQIGIAADNLGIAAESLDLHTFSYQEGMVSLLELQSAQIAWLQARTNLVSAWRNGKLSAAAYNKAAGL